MRRPKKLGTALLALSVGLAALTVAPPAVAAGTASISGEVTVPSGANPANVSVQAVVPPGSPSTGMLPQTRVDANGKYTLSGLEAGSYKLQFSYCSECSMVTPGVKTGPDVAAIWSGDVDSFDQGSLTTVTAGQAVSGVSVHMNLGATISGRLNLPAGIDPSTVAVSARTTTNYYSSYGSTRPKQDGTYTIPALPSGQYMVSYHHMANTAAILAGYYGGQNEANATPVAVPRLGSVAGIDLTARAAGIISGSVSVPAGLHPEQVPVLVYAAGGDYRNTVASVRPQADGTFTVGGLPAGSYKLAFEGWLQKIPTLWLGTAQTPAASRTVTVTEGQTTSGINQTMELGSTISGKIDLPPFGTPVLAGGATLLNADGSVFNVKPFDPNGAFSFSGLPSGSYTVAFNRTSGYTTNLEAQFFKDVPESAGAAAATKITVAPGETRSDLTASIRVGGTITGTVFDATGVPRSALVRAYTEDGSLVTRGTTSAPDGSFTLTGLTTGKYLVTAVMFVDANEVEAPSVSVSTTVGANTDMGTLIFAPSEEPTPPAPVFKDIAPGTQFSTEISWLASRGISTGWDEGNGVTSYRPLTPVNRDAMAAFMYRLAGKPAFTAPAASPFVDMLTTTQFYPEITWLADRKISTGWTDGTSATYRPVTAVNRDAMAAFLYRLAGKPEFTPPATSPFADVATDNQFYKEITWLAAQKISTGWDEGNNNVTYRPLQSVNRDAMAAFMYRWNTKYGTP